MSSRGFRERILEIDQDGAALSNTVTQTSILPAANKTAGFPIGYFDRVRSIVFEFTGRITIPASANTLALALRLGSTDVLSSGAMGLNATSKTNVHWRFSGELVNRAYGSGTATVFFPKGCSFESEALVGAAVNMALKALLPYGAAPAVGTGIDNSLSNVEDVLATWGTAAATYSIMTQAGHIDVYS